MLTNEDRELLGIAIAKRTRRPSAVSQILRAISENLDGPDAWRLADDREKFRVLIASNRQTRERAYRLAYNVYRSKGYVPHDDRGMIVAEYDARPETVTVLVEDEQGCAAGTVTLVFDAGNSLPCDEIFAPEVSALRLHGRRLLEVTRLAIDPAHAHSKTLLTLLCNAPFAYGLRVGGCTDLVIEVNPRHVAYYRRLLKFEILAGERACPRVQGAPAVLLRMDLGRYVAEMRRIGGTGANCAERSLFPYFYAGAQEWEFARFMACQQKLMSEADAQYFGIRCLEGVSAVAAT
jgi:hypothetical protein